MNTRSSVRVVLVPVAFAFALAAMPSVAVAPSQDDVRRLIADGRYADAEKAARELLADTEISKGCESIETAEVIDSLVTALWRGGKARSSEALELAERAIGIKERRLGPQDPRLADSLAVSGNLMRARGQYDESKGRLGRALAIVVETLGPDDVRAGHIHNDLANQSYELAPGDAERHRREALRIFEAAEGPESVGGAHALNGLANHAADRGRFTEAEELYRRSLRVYETALGPRHPQVAASYNNLGYLHIETGDYEQARIELQRALSLREETIGRAHRLTITTLGNLAIAETKLGLPASRWEEAVELADSTLGPDHDVSAGMRANYASFVSEIDPEKSRRLNEQAYAAFSRILGAEHWRSLWVLTNLGHNELRLGDPTTAAAHLERALSGFAKVPDAQGNDVSSALRGLANCRAEAGHAAEARALHERAIAIREKAYGPEHPDLAGFLVEFGAFLREGGDLSGSKALNARALAILEKSLGSDHPSVGGSLFALADIEVETGRLAKAMPLLKRALSIQERARTPDDPRNASGYRTYASYQLKRGDPGKALDAALRAESISTRYLRSTLAGLPERQALNVVTKAPSALGLAISAAIALEQPAAAMKVFDALVRTRALVLDEMARRQRTLSAEDSPEASRLLDAYTAARARLSSLAVMGEDERFPQKSRKRIETARAEKDAAERALADRSWEFRQSRTRAVAGLNEISSSVPRGSALVAFVRYPHTPASVVRGTPVDSYAAFVLPFGARAPALVPLGPASEMDRKTAAVRDSLAKTALVLAGPAGPSTVSYRRAAAALREIVFDPLRPHLAGARTVLLVPDGSLHLVSFAALPVGVDSYLAETGPVFHYLSSERDLVDRGSPSGSGILVAGAPDFDSPPLPRALRRSESLLPASMASAATAPIHRGPPPACRDFASLKFDALPAAKRELDEVAAAWRDGTGVRASSAWPRPAGHEGIPVVLSGLAADEQAIKEGAPGRHVIHVTTHGFFLGDCSPADGVAEKRRAARTASLYAENPLLLSGLALTGANRRGAAVPGADDGILTAEEVASLDLSGTEWVVLSACETGLGEPRAGEGLFGLRRAFQVAGARTLITSLWPVEDESSRRWMRALYQRRFGSGLSTAESVREASLAVLKERRAAGQSTHPFFWAGFVAAGDWR